VGEFLTEHFAAGWKKLGTFTYHRTPNCESRIGGNVVAYFCTPDLKILHAVWCPVQPRDFLEQATWAVELAGKLKSRPAGDWTAIARAAHERNPYLRNKGMWNGTGLDHETRYRLMMKKLLAPLDPSASELFLQLVNEKTIADDWMDRLRDPSRRNPNGLFMEPDSLSWILYP
jgi:hypothetical protein